MGRPWAPAGRDDGDDSSQTPWRAAATVTREAAKALKRVLAGN